MITLTIKIEEMGDKKLKEFLATDVKVEMKTKAYIYTEAEKKCLEHIKKALECKKPVQVINESKKDRKKLIDDLVDELFGI